MQGFIVPGARLTTFWQRSYTNGAQRCATSATTDILDIYNSELQVCECVSETGTCVDKMFTLLMGP